MRARQLNVEHLPLLPEGRGWLMAELGADDPAEADRLADAFVAGLPADVTWRRFDDAERQARVWLIRESGLGAAAIAADGTRHLEGWEDAAVAPERLGSYLRALTALWDEFGYSGALYGHFGQGCVHTRNNFDLRTPRRAGGIPAIRRPGRGSRRVAGGLPVGRARGWPVARGAAGADVRAGAGRRVPRVQGRLRSRAAG